MAQTAIKNIVVYTKNNCLYCSKAKALIKGLGFSFIEKNFETDFKSIEDLFKELGKTVRTMPQIKIDEELIGGYNQLIEFKRFKKSKAETFSRC